MRKRLEFPELSPRHIADEAKGDCDVYIHRGDWRIDFFIGLKRSMKDHDLDLVALANGFWIGFDGEGPTAGWRVLSAAMHESTLRLTAKYRRNDLRELERRRQVRISPRVNLLGTPGGILLDLRGVRFPNGTLSGNPEDEPPF